MSKAFRELTSVYITTLRKYLVDGREAVLEEAYDLGRKAIGLGFGVLDMARVHEEALKHLLRPLLVMEGQERILEAKETFLLETLTPFEATHRGFRETSSKLLARNRQLNKEIAERRRTERALRQSEKHFRELLGEAREMEERLRHLSNQVLHVQEEERKRISRELHDEIGQAMTAISINLGIVGRDAAGSPEGLCRRLADTQALLEETMETVHRFARELRPTMLDELGLLPALRSYLNAFADRTGVRVEFEGKSEAERLDPDRKTAVFRVAQESLTNVAKHARATRVRVVISSHKDFIRMKIADNGKSFRAEARNRAGRGARLGLLGMQERLRLVNGSFAISAAPGRGTTVRVEVPLDRARGPGNPARAWSRPRSPLNNHQPRAGPRNP